LALHPDRAEVASVTLPHLPPRQRQVLDLVAEGKSNKQIARDLGLSCGTIKVHLALLFKTLGVTSRSAAAVTLVRHLQAQAQAQSQAHRCPHCQCQGHQQ
jgi:DNA-binding NarL/FixJ family response regulator